MANVPLLTRARTRIVNLYHGLRRPPSRKTTLEERRGFLKVSAASAATVGLASLGVSGCSVPTVELTDKDKTFVILSGRDQDAIMSGFGYGKCDMDKIANHEPFGKTNNAKERYKTWYRSAARRIVKAYEHRGPEKISKALAKLSAAQKEAVATEVYNVLIAKSAKSESVTDPMDWIKSQENGEAAYKEYCKRTKGIKHLFNPPKFPPFVAKRLSLKRLSQIIKDVKGGKISAAAENCAPNNTLCGRKIEASANIPANSRSSGVPFYGTPLPKNAKVNYTHQANNGITVAAVKPSRKGVTATVAVGSGVSVGVYQLCITAEYNGKKTLYNAVITVLSAKQAAEPASPMRTKVADRNKGRRRRPISMKPKKPKLKTCPPGPLAPTLRAEGKCK